jgi:hypothetical protein
MPRLDVKSITRVCASNWFPVQTNTKLASGRRNSRGCVPIKKRKRSDVPALSISAITVFTLGTNVLAAHVSSGELFPDTALVRIFCAVVQPRITSSSESGPVARVFCQALLAID